MVSDYTPMHSIGKFRREKSGVWARHNVGTITVKLYGNPLNSFAASARTVCA